MPKQYNKGNKMWKQNGASIMSDHFIIVPELHIQAIVHVYKVVYTVHTMYMPHVQRHVNPESVTKNVASIRGWLLFKVGFYTRLYGT